MKRAKFNSDRNCSHCLFYRAVDWRELDGYIICGTCSKSHTPNLIKYHGVTCEDFMENPKDPVPHYKLTEEEKEARSQIRRSRRLKGDRTKTSIKAFRNPEYYKPLNIKAPLIKSKKKQQRFHQILSDNKEVKKLMDQLFALPKRSSKEGRKIRKELRKIGFYLSKRGDDTR